MPNLGLYATTPKQRTYTQLDAGIIGNSLKQIYDDRENAAKQQSAITLALAQMRDKMHGDEASYMNDYINNIQNQIEGLAAEGDYRAAINSAITLAGKAAADPGIAGRIKANTEYQKFVEQTQARNDISQDTKDWALAMNPYSYQDKRDKNGNVIGGTEWKPNITPVSQVDFNNLLAKVKQMVFQESGGSQQIVFTDAEGNETTNPELGAFGVRYYKDNKWQGISREKLNSLVEAAIDNTPGARDSIRQDWNVANWKYNQLSEEDKQNAANTMPELFASNGRKYTYKDYYNNRFGRAIQAMSGMNYTSSIKYDSDYGEYMKMKRLNAISAANPGDDSVKSIVKQMGSVKGNPVIVDGSTTINKAFGSLTDSINNLEKLYPWLRKEIKWEEAKNDGNFNWLASKIAGSNYIMNGEHGDIARRLVRELRSNASIYNSVASAPNVDKEAIAFNASVLTGVDLPANNKYSQAFTDVYNKMLYDDTESIRYQFDSHSDMLEFARNNGIPVNDKSRCKVDTSNGKEYIQLDASDPLNYRAVTEYQDFVNSKHAYLNNLFANIFNPRLPLTVNHAGSTKAIKTNTETAIAESQVQGNTPQLGYIPQLKNLIRNTGAKASRDIGTVGSNQLITETKFVPLPEIQIAYEQYGNNIEDAGKYNSAVSAAKETYLQNYLPLLGAANYEMMIYDPEKQIYTTVSMADQASMVSTIQTYIGNTSKDDINLSAGVLNGKVGLAIDVPAQWSNTKNKYIVGDIKPQKVVIFGMDIPMINAMENETNFKATTKYEKLSQISRAKEIGFDGSAIQFNAQGQAVLITSNGDVVPLSRDGAIEVLDRYEGYNQCRDAMMEGNLNAPQMIAKFVQGAYGYAPGTPEFNNAFLNIQQQIVAEQ